MIVQMRFLSPCSAAGPEDLHLQFTRHVSAEGATEGHRHASSGHLLPRSARCKKGNAGLYVVVMLGFLAFQEATCLSWWSRNQEALELGCTGGLLSLFVVAARVGQQAVAITSGGADPLCLLLLSCPLRCRCTLGFKCCI